MAGKKYKKADEARIEGNKIFSPVRQKWLTLTPEEEVRQQYLTVLIDETLENFQRTYGIFLELIDMGTEEDGTFPIHQKMYEAIARSEIIICDLTGHRPNVYAEAGYALKHHQQNRLIYLFEPQDSGDRVPFDLNTFKYVQISQAAEIPGRLTPEIKAILEDAGAILERETT